MIESAIPVHVLEKIQEGIPEDVLLEPIVSEDISSRESKPVSKNLET